LFDDYRVTTRQQTQIPLPADRAGRGGAAGELVPVVDRVFDLDHVADAHRALEDRTLHGKALIRVSR
jgi:hypothetical protein